MCPSTQCAGNEIDRTGVKDNIPDPRSTEDPEGYGPRAAGSWTASAPSGLTLAAIGLAFDADTIVNEREQPSLPPGPDTLICR